MRLVNYAYARLMLFGENAKVIFRANARLVSFVDARVRFVLRDARLMFIL